MQSPKEKRLWEKSYPENIKWDAQIESASLGEMVDKAALEFGERAAFDFRNQLISFKTLHENVTAFAYALHEKCDLSSTLALYLPNMPYHSYGFLGAAKAGMRLTHLSPLDAERVLIHKLRDSGAKTIFTVNFAPLFPVALKLLEQGVVERLIVGEDAAFGLSHIPVMDIPNDPRIVTYVDFIANVKPRPLPLVDKETIALIQYTGGTTGLPKGAMLSHRNLTAAISSYQTWFEGLDIAQGEDAKVILVLPLFHIYALTPLFLRNIKLGVRSLLHMRFDVESVLHDIEVKGANSFPGVPTMWIAIANHPNVEKRDFSRLAYVASGGAPMPVEIAKKLEGITGKQFRGGWGMTETSPAGSNIPPDTKKIGSIGVPLPGIDMGIVHLENPNLRLGVGETGEIIIKGQNVFSGYLNQPEATKKAFNAEGFFLTGDIGYMDEDGYFYIVDRKNDMIISGGFNVYPQMIEQAIYEHPTVFEVIVIGVKDAYRGEAAKAYISLKEGAVAPTLEEMQAFLKTRVGKHEMISGLEVRAVLPKTPVGKLSRAELRKELSSSIAS